MPWRILQYFTFGTSWLRSESPSPGEVDWQQLRISYGAPSWMIESEWVGLYFPCLCRWRGSTWGKSGNWETSGVIIISRITHITQFCWLIYGLIWIDQSISKICSKRSSIQEHLTSLSSPGIHTLRCENSRPTEKGSEGSLSWGTLWYTFSDFFLIIPVVVVEACLLKDNTQNFELFGCLGMLKHHYEILWNWMNLIVCNTIYIVI